MISFISWLCMIGGFMLIVSAFIQAIYEVIRNWVRRQVIHQMIHTSVETAIQRDKEDVPSKVAPPSAQ